MKFAKSVLMASAVAFACGVAFAADDKERKGFNDMDKNADGKLTRAEAKGNKELLGKWKEVDKDGDGSLSRAEYLQAAAKQDASTVKNKVSKEVDQAKRRAPDASTGSTAKSDSGKPK